MAAVPAMCGAARWSPWRADVNELKQRRSYRMAVIPGDGIGKEVIPEGVRAIERAAQLYGFDVRQNWHDFASCDYYVKHGQIMPDDWKERIPCRQ